MLSSLSIRNYALIHHLDVDFHKGFSVITGETGAGKSILIGALSLLLGKRADPTVISNTAKKCIVEGTFHLQSYAIRKIFVKNDWDIEKEIIIRREVNSNGKSRAFINDTPANLQQLKELTFLLVDIHSQHQNLLLNDKDFQMNIIDGVAKNVVIKNKYNQLFSNYQLKIRELSKLEESAKKNTADTDYLAFQLKQLEEAGLKDGEQDKLEDEQKMLNHTEEIKTALHQSFFLLEEDEDQAVISNLSGLTATLRPVENFMPKLKKLTERLESVQIEIQDISSDLQHLNEELQHDPDRLSFVNERLDLIYSLQQKHKLNSIRELLDLQAILAKKIQNINSFDEQLEQLTEEISAMKKELLKLAALITASRKKCFPKIANETMHLLQQLGMPNAKVEIKHSKSDELLADGQDLIDFFFTANKNTELQPIEKIASGGEISRLMLCVKYLNSHLQHLPTLIFDEIDTGLSGEIAQKAGKMLQRLAEQRQILSITHLPQIAALGENHFYVFKDEGLQKTTTLIKRLSKKERILELAKLLSGEKPGKAAMQNAAELLG